MKTASLLVFCLLLIALCGIAGAALPDYQVTDLGTLYGIDSYGMAINSAGQAVGYASNQDGDFRAFIYTPGSGMKDLGTLGGFTSMAYGINDSGAVVGYSGTLDLGDRAFLYSDQSGMLDLGIPPPNDVGATSSLARAINNSGQITGYMQTVDFSQHAFLYSSNSGLLDISGSESYGFGINASGQVVGQAATTSGEYHAFLYTPGAGMEDLGLPPGGIYSVATDVNDSGVVVGYCWTSAAQNRAFVYAPGSGTSDLGTLGGNGAQAYGISNSGLIVGDVDVQGATQAFVYASDGSMALLPGIGGAQSHARGISESGQIVGFASSPGGMPRAVIWTPILEQTLPAAEVKMMIFPRTLNPRSRGNWVSCVIEVSGARTVRDIDPKSLRLQGSIPPAGKSVICDVDRDRIPEMVTMFSRCALAKTLGPGMQTVTLTGKFKDGSAFEAKDTIRVLKK